MKMLAGLVMSALLLISPSLYADSVTGGKVVLGGFTTHLSPEPIGGYNEWNKYVGVVHNDVYLGYFENSFYRKSALLGYEIYNYKVGRFLFAVSAGVASGYGDNCKYKISGDICPYIALHTEYDFGIIDPQVSLFGEAVVLTFGISYDYLLD